MFCNNSGAGDWAYAALNGKPIDFSLVNIRPVPRDVGTIVITSDGYPLALPTLEASEDLLDRLLTQDPLCIGPLLGTKGVSPGNVSYDDRSYLKIEI
jgi:hypothetical protein